MLKWHSGQAIIVPRDAVNGGACNEPMISAERAAKLPGPPARSASAVGSTRILNFPFFQQADQAPRKIPLLQLNVLFHPRNKTLIQKIVRIVNEFHHGFQMIAAVDPRRENLECPICG